MKVNYKEFLQNPMKFFDINEFTDCWIYKGRLKDSGHGIITLYPSGKKLYTHVYMYEQKYGPVPLGYVLDHFKCNTPSCSNPDHVKPETRNYNMNRPKMERTHCPNGHEYTPENTYKSPGHGKECITCRKERASRRIFVNGNYVTTL